jgi:putative transposase
MMWFHLILVIKYRHKVLDDDISKSELSKFINAYKSLSSRLIKNEFPQLREKLWKSYFWSQSFCLLTSGGAPIEVIQSYIESQGEKS